MILAHELGHYLTARLFDVHVLEFSIGMGPKIISKRSKKSGIVYSLRLLPIGGYVRMVGEDADDGPAQRIENAEDPGAAPGETEADGADEPSPHGIAADDPRSLSKKPKWQRFIILASGGVTNIVIGMLLASVLVITMPALGSTVIGEFEENAVSDSVLQKGDVVVKINGNPVSGHLLLAYSIMYYGDRPIDVTVIRGADIRVNDDGEVVSYSGGERITLEDVVFPSEKDAGSGATFGNMDFRVYRAEKNFGRVVSQSLEYSGMMIKTVWDSIYDLIRGRFGFEAVSGPVGVSSEIGAAAESGPSGLIYVVAILSINLGIVNLLPVPALDGGHILFLLIETVIRRPIKASVKSRINTVAIMLIFGFAIVVMIKDFIGLFT